MSPRIWNCWRCGAQWKQVTRGSWVCVFRPPGMCSAKDHNIRGGGQ